MRTNAAQFGTTLVLGEGYYTRAPLDTRVRNSPVDQIRASDRRWDGNPTPGLESARVEARWIWGVVETDPALESDSPYLRPGSASQG